MKQGWLHALTSMSDRMHHVWGIVRRGVGGMGGGEWGMRGAVGVARGVLRPISLVRLPVSRRVLPIIVPGPSFP